MGYKYTPPEGTGKKVQGKNSGTKKLDSAEVHSKEPGGGGTGERHGKKKMQGTLDSNIERSSHPVTRCIESTKKVQNIIKAERNLLRRTQD